VAALALAPLAVLPGYETLHAGTRLMREGIRRCTERGHRIVIVLGHAKYYRRFGFRPANDFGIHAPWQVAPANFQVLALAPGALEGVTGTVRYPPAFDAV
jgi:putative acetyltransferase